MEQFFHELWIARWALAQGLLLTVEISLASIFCGTIIGLFAGIGLTYGKWPLRLPIRALVDCIRGIPVLVLILASFYLLTFAGINLTAIESGSSRSPSSAVPTWAKSSGVPCSPFRAPRSTRAAPSA